MKCVCKFVSIVIVASSVLNCFALKYDPSTIYSYSYQTDILLNEVNSKKATRAQQDVGVQLSISFDLSTVYKDAESQMFRLSEVLNTYCPNEELRLGNDLIENRNLYIYLDQKITNSPKGNYEIPCRIAAGWFIFNRIKPILQQIRKAQTTSAIHPDVKKDLEGSLHIPVLFQMKGDLVENLRFANKDSTFSRNVKKGIVAIFQVQENSGKRREVDVSGECEVSYTLSKPDHIVRSKADCKNLEIAKQFSNTNKALGISLYIRSSQLYKLKDSIIDNVSGSQRVITYLNIRTALSGVATSSQNLQYESQHAGSTLASSVAEAILDAEKEAASKYSLTLLPSEEEIQQCTEGCLHPKDLAANLSEDLKAENIATVKSAKAFIQMLKAFRGSGKVTLAGILTNPNSYYIVPQLIDVATAAQTESAREALLELLDFEDPDAIEHPQRFLFAAAYSSHPSESFITDLLSVLKKPIPNDKLRESLLLSLGAIVHTFCQVKDHCSSPIISDIKALITSGLSNCKEEQCLLMYLRALGNAGLASTIGVILTFAESPGNPMVSSTAILAFRRIDERFITSQVKDTLLRIFHQNKASYDSSVRLAALEFILDHQPSEQVIRNVLLSCLDQSNAELSTYIVRMLFDAASVNPSISSQLSSVLQDTQINNYNILSQIGKSSVITSYLAQMTDLNGTYNLYFENSQSGVMKQSGMIVNLQGKTIKQPLMKFGIYANGLESLTGDAETMEDVNESVPTAEPTAGMSFTFMDVLLTQVEFFRGMSGLMSAAWNAPTELTSALQGNLLLQDHSQRIHLSNGLVLDTRVLGALSLDLSGYISISLWNRNCEALIRNSGAMYIEGSLRVNSAELDVGLVFTGEGESKIDYTSNVDFYEMPPKLCMQMMRPDFEFIQKFEKHEELVKGKKYRSRRSQKSKLYGEEYLLNRANSDECRVMLKED